MGQLGAFLKIPRAEPLERDPKERVHDVREFVRPLPLLELRNQGARCMECGVPFCHHGCPLGNLIPDWNDLVYRDRWREAIDQLHRTNNFPEFTGRLCPAPCEAACVLEIREGDAVTIKQIELSIVDRAWEEGWIVPRPAGDPHRPHGGRDRIGPRRARLRAAARARSAIRSPCSSATSRAAASSGSACRSSRSRSGIVERRLDQLVAEGVELRYGVDVGVDISADELRASYDAVVVATGSRVPRDLPVPGRELDGIHFAMDYLYDRARAIAAEVGTAGELAPPPERPITAAGKHVIVIGGGDTGADCVANAHRENAASVTQIEVLGEPPREPPGRPHAVAAVADEAAHVVRAEGGRRPRLRDLDDASFGLERLGRAHPLGAERRRAAVRAAAGHGGVTSGRARAARDGIPPPRAAAARAARRRARRPRQCRGSGLSRRRWTACSPPATPAAVSRSSSGRSTKAASAPSRSNNWLDERAR